MWEEPFPNSEEATRVAGLLMAEEKLENVTTFVNNLQESAEAEKDEITFTYKGGEYSFVSKFCEVTKRELCVITVTHKYIHWIQYGVKILVHLMLGHHSWIQGKNMEAAIKVKMDQVQDALWPCDGKIGIAFNMPTNGESGGNTTTAEAARKVYQTPELRDRLVAPCPGQYKFVFGEILFQHQPHSPTSLQQQRTHGSVH